MIPLTRLNHTPFFLNVDLIEQVEATPDTVITLTTGAKLKVSESAEALVATVNEFRRRERRFLDLPERNQPNYDRPPAEEQPH